MKYKNWVQEIALGVGLYISSARHTAQRGFVSAGLLKLGFFCHNVARKHIRWGKGIAYWQHIDTVLRSEAEGKSRMKKIQNKQSQKNYCILQG